MSSHNPLASNFLRSIVSAPSATIEELTRIGSVAVIVAHPDDETLGCGMAMAAAAREGVTLHVVLLTNGEGSHPHSLEYPPTKLTDLRSAELAQALTHFGTAKPIKVTKLGLADGGSSDARISPPAKAELVSQLIQRETSAIWSHWIGDPHSDHIAVAMLAEELAAALDVPWWSCPIWGRFSDRAAPPGQTRIFYDEAANRAKRKAMAEYASQFTGLIADDPGGFCMEPDVFDHFADAPEIFIRER